MKRFNTLAVCLPSKHYMVDVSEKISAIKQLVDDGKYFTINRARQYSKTTVLNELTNILSNQYIVLNISFEGIEDAGFSDSFSFVKEFCRLLKRAFRYDKRIGQSIRENIDNLFKQQNSP